MVGVISLIIRFSTKDKKENKTEKLLTIKDFNEMQLNEIEKAYKDLKNRIESVIRIMFKEKRNKIIRYIVVPNNATKQEIYFLKQAFEKYKNEIEESLLNRGFSVKYEYNPENNKYKECIQIDIELVTEIDKKQHV